MAHDLSGDWIVDDAHATALMQRPEFVEDDDVAEVVRDFGPKPPAKTGR